MNRRVFTTVLCLVSVLAVFAVYFGFTGKNHKNVTEITHAAGDSVTIDTEAKWNTGTKVNVDTASLPNSIKMTDTALGGTKFDLQGLYNSSPGSFTIGTSNVSVSNWSNIFDSDTGTGWQLTNPHSTHPCVAGSANKGWLWLIVDLGGSYNFNSVRMSKIQTEIPAGIGNYVSFGSSYTDDGGNHCINTGNYTSLGGASFNTNSAGIMETQPVSIIGARYAVIGESFGVTDWNESQRLNEVELYTGYSSTHTSASTQLDAGAHSTVGWTTFVPNGTNPNGNTSMSFRFRTSANTTNWSAWSASTPYAASIDISGLTQQRYLQVESTLADSDGVSTPTLNSYTANYDYTDPAAPTCSDGIQNGSETGVDCGGSCGACPVVPPTPTCSDGIQNGSETGIDCGGSCGACPVTPPVVPPVIPPVIPPPPPYACMFGWEFLNSSWFCGDATDMVLILTSPNDGGSYKIGDYIPISFKFNAGNLASDIDKTPMIKSPSLFADVYLTTDSVNYFKVLTDIDYSKNAQKVDNGYILTSLQYQLYNDANLSTSKGKFLVRIHTNSADSPATFVPNPETSGYFSYAYDTSDKPFTILGDTIPNLTTIHITIEPTDVTLKMGGKTTIIAKATDQNGLDVTNKTVFTFKVSDGGSIESQQGNIAVIVAGKNEIKLADAINVTGEYSGASANASASLNVVGNKPICVGEFCLKIPPDVCVGSACVLLTREQVLATSTTAPIAVGALIALLASITALAANLFTLVNPSQAIAYYVKGFEKKAKCLVYDAITGLPIPLAIILLFRASDKKLMSTVVSDRVGMFSVVAPPDTECFIQVRKDHYDLRQLNVYIEKSLKYQNNYFGGNFKLTAENPIFAKAIPLISTDTSNIVAKRFSAWERASRILRFVNFPILVFGFATAIIVLYDNKTIYNEVIVAIYTLTFVYYLINTFFINGKTVGKVTKSMSTEPIQLALVRAITANTKKLYRTVASDEKGRFVMTAKKGSYDIISSKAGFEQDDSINVSIKSNFQPVKEQIWMSNVFNYDNLSSVAENQPAEPTSNENREVITEPALKLPESNTIPNPMQEDNNPISVPDHQPTNSEPKRSFNDSSQIIENFHQSSEYQNDQNDTIRE